MCNITAHSILKAAGNEEKESLQASDLKKPRFHPSRFRRENDGDGNGENTHAETQYNQTLSILQIIDEAEVKEVNVLGTRSDDDLRIFKL